MSGLCLVGRTQCTPLGYATVLSMICVWVNTCVDSHKSANASCTHGIGVVALLGQATTHLIAQCLVGPRGCPLCGIQATTRRQRIEFMSCSCFLVAFALVVCRVPHPLASNPIQLFWRLSPAHSFRQVGSRLQPAGVGPSFRQGTSASDV